jgi:cbb3-type cytochrome oxidase maturation protein
MEIIILLICISVIIAGGFLGAFYWSFKSGQYDDTYTPSIRMLFEEKDKKSTAATTKDSAKTSK